MPEKSTIARAKKDLRRGKSPSTAASEFVREEIHHIRRGKHGARSPEQAIAIGLSKARRAGVPLKPPAPGRTSTRTRRQAQRDIARSRGRKTTASPRRRAASRGALERESKSAASKRALSKHARRTASRRTGAARKRASRSGARARRTR